MSILTTFRSTRTHGRRTGRRGSSSLARALAKAPTRASREELLNLQNMGR